MELSDLSIDCSDKTTLYLAMISVKHRIKINRHSVFSFSITCLVLQMLHGGRVTLAEWLP